MTKILVIEDEAGLRTEVLDWLTFEGYEAIGAVDGVDGVNCAFRDPPDLIVCDIMMPRLDGYGVLLEVRGNSLTRLTPIIFMTAKATREDLRQGMVAGVDDYITKPFAREDLLQAIRTRLEKHQALEEEQQRRAAKWQQALKQEREQQMLRAKLIAMFSHDFRNPLSSIMSSINLMREFIDQMDETRRLMHLNRMEASVRQLLQMLDDTLLVAQMETGNLRFDPQPLSLDELVRSIVDEFQTVHTATHRLVYESRVSGTALADPRLLRQITANLISNAIKYSPDGTEVHVTLDKADGQYVLKVQDQGIGIPEADQMRLFNAFQRGSNVSDIAGTGLGLAIVGQAVDLQGGSVYRESQIGKGTTVTVAIPVQSA